MFKISRNRSQDCGGQCVAISANTANCRGLEINIPRINGFTRLFNGYI